MHATLSAATARLRLIVESLQLACLLCCKCGATLRPDLDVCNLRLGESKPIEQLMNASSVPSMRIIGE